MEQIKTPFKVGGTMIFQLPPEEEADPFDGIEIIDSDGNEALIVPTDAIGYAYELSARVVLALNSYDALLSACEFWLGAVQNSLGLRLALTSLPEGAGPALVEMLQEAITQAKGETEMSQ